MKKLLFAVVCILAVAAAAASAAPGPASVNQAVVILHGLPVYQDKSGALVATPIDYLTVGDKVTLLNKTATFKENGKDRSFLMVRAPSGKEGWARVSYVIPKATLAVVRADSAIVYTEPRDVKVTSRTISNLTIVAVLQDGSTAEYGKIFCVDTKQNAYWVDTPIFVTMDTLTTADVDVNAAILYSVASATKNQDVKKNLLTVALNKYGSSVFTPKIQQALGVTPTVAKDTTPAAGIYVVNADNVNVRATPDEVGGKVLAQLDTGAPVEVTAMTSDSYTVGGKTAAWYKITDPEGWIFGAFIDPQE